METKICSRSTCVHKGLPQNKSNFNKDHRATDGLTSECKDCIKEYQQKYYLKNKDKIDQRNKKYNKNNPEKLKEIYSNRYERIKDYRRSKEWLDYVKAYRQANLPRYAAYSSKRRALLVNQISLDANLVQIQWLFELAAIETALTGIPHQIDHTRSLYKGGMHEHLNLRIIPATENQSKGHKI